MTDTVAAAADGPRRLMDFVSGTRTTLTEMRDMESATQVFDAASSMVVSRCGFDRCILFVVVGTELVAQAVCFGDDSAWAARTLAIGREPRGRPRLGDSIIETDLLRRRAAALILDAQADPRTPRALVEETATRSYVAAPVVCEDRVVAFLHADQYFKGVPVDEIDREGLSLFAVGLGLLLERLVVRQHLRQRREQFKRLASDVDAAARAVARVDIDLLPFGLAATDDETVALDVPRSAEAHAALTGREREVLDLLVSGATNAVIARRLFVAESTAKAHVGHILKKLGAANRADAVSKYLRGG